MKDCSSVSKLLERYFDQEVTEGERSLVERHLPDCLSCQNEVKSMEGLRNLLKSPIDEVAQKEDFQWVWQKVKRGIELRERPTWWEVFQSWLGISSLFRRRVWIPAVAVAVILILVTAQMLFKKSTFHPNSSVVEYVESQTNNVMVYESETGEVAVIWLFEGPEQEMPVS